MALCCAEGGGSLLGRTESPGCNRVHPWGLCTCHIRALQGVGELNKWKSSMSKTEENLTTISASRDTPSWQTAPLCWRA